MGRDGREVLLSTLRTRTIRLAASLPLDAEVRRLLLAAVESSDDAANELVELLQANDLTPQDVIDLATFVYDMPSAVGGSAKSVSSNFAAWWGGKVPAYWDIPSKDLAAMVEAFSTALPMLGALAHKAMGSTAEGDAEGGQKKKASGMVMMAVAASAYQAERDHHHAGGGREHRTERARSRDPKYKGPSGGPTVSNAVFESKKDGKKHTFKEGSLEAYTKWSEDLEYEDYTWAKEKIGEEPKPREKWEHDRPNPRVWFGEISEKLALPRLKATDEANIAQRVRDAIDAKGEDADIKADVAARTEAAHKNLASSYRNARKKYVEGDFSDEEQRRFRELFKEERASASKWEKFVGFFAPDWAEKKVKERVETRSDTEKAERKAPRSYEEYASEKKRDGMRPMERDEWESRYRG